MLTSFRPSALCWLICSHWCVPWQLNPPVSYLAARTKCVTVGWVQHYSLQTAFICIQLIDIRKLRSARNLKPPLSNLSKRMLDSFQATCKKIEGTQEVRTVMRHELNAYWVAKGQSILVTFSPNERHNMIMIRLSRTRNSDPLAKHKSCSSAAVQCGIKCASPLCGRQARKRAPHAWTVARKRVL